MFCVTLVTHLFNAIALFFCALCRIVYAVTTACFLLLRLFGCSYFIHVQSFTYSHVSCNLWFDCYCYVKDIRSNIYHVFDANDDGTVSFRDFCVTLARACLGPGYDRQCWLFELFHTSKNTSTLTPAVISHAARISLVSRFQFSPVSYYAIAGIAGFSGVLCFSGSCAE